jgi:hypothetical protein
LAAEAAVGSSSIVEVEPAGEHVVAFVAGVVDRTVGPAAEQGANEAFRLAVGARRVRPGAEVFDAQRFASERVDRGAVCVAVVGHQPLDPDPEGGEVGDRAAQEADRGRGFLVLEHLDVGEPRGVVDRDVNVLPADPAAPTAPVAVHAVPGPADPAELLDVDVDELARPRLLVPVRRLERLQPPQLAEPDSGQDPRHGRERHPQRLGDLRPAHP